MKKDSRFILPDFAEDIYRPDDLVPIYYERNGCGYRWGIPFKNFQSFQQLNEPFVIEELLSLDAKLLDILVIGRYSIDFKNNKTGVRKLDVVVRSAESDDRQLLHKLSNKFRVKDKQVDKDSIPGTNNDE